MYYLLMLVTSYLLGSISFAVVVSRLMDLPDPHSYGSGNPGATNVLLSGSRVAACLTLLGDAAKGWLAVMLMQMLSAGDGPYTWSNSVASLAGLAAFFGHIYPVFHRFAGGKGVATLIGVVSALSPALALTTIASWLFIMATLRHSALLALAGTLLTPMVVCWQFGFSETTLVILVMNAVVIYRHLPNMKASTASS